MSLVIVIDVVKNIANKVASFGATGNLGQEVGPIVPSTNVSKAGFIHSHRFAAGVIADGVAFFLSTDSGLEEFVIADLLSP